MNNKIKGLLVLVLGAGVTFSAFAGKGHGNRGDKNRIAVKLIGTGHMYTNIVPDIDGDGMDDMAECYDLDLINLKTGKTFGTGTDCISNIRNVGGSVAADATFTVNMPKGSMVVRTKSTAAPLTNEATRADGGLYTHVAGASSHENRVLSGTGKYRSRSGTVRLNGLMDWSKYTGQPGDPLYIDCILEINLDPRW
ncbi:MAG: hypothetical protein ACI9WC_002494 [Arenicella sp.]|jgi:hypothetical protein